MIASVIGQIMITPIGFLGALCVKIWNFAGRSLQHTKEVTNLRYAWPKQSQSWQSKDPPARWMEEEG